MNELEARQFITDTIKKLLEFFEVSARVDEEEHFIRGLTFQITSNKARFLIGMHGKNLYALEYLIHTICQKKLRANGLDLKFSIDINKYKRLRFTQLEKALKNKIEQMAAENIAQTVLIPLNSFERRYIHNLIQNDYPNYTSQSFGEGENRRIKIERI